MLYRRLKGHLRRNSFFLHHETLTGLEISNARDARSRHQAEERSRRLRNLSRLPC